MAPSLTTVRRRLVRAARVARNALIDLRHGSLLGLNQLRRGSSYSNSDHQALARIFEGRIRPDDVLVDVGCGVGRVLNWWLRNAPGQRTIGIEIDPRVAEMVRRRLRKHANVSIVTGDVTEALPEDGTLFFVFNPFLRDSDWTGFNERLLNSRRGDTRVRILCHNCARLQVFREDPAWEVSEVVDFGGDPTAPLGSPAVIQMRA